MRTYTAEERAEAVALAASIGPKRAAEQLGYPPRTVAAWMHRPSSVVILADANRAIAERLREAHSEALEVVRAGLRDRKARLADKATALRVLGEQLALAEGRATQNIEVHSDGATDDDLGPDLTDEERSELKAYLDQRIAAGAVYRDHDTNGGSW